MLNPHKAQGMAARIVSNLLSGILQTDMVETILQGHGLNQEEIVAIKAEIGKIADQNKQSSEYHKLFWDVE